MSSSIRVKFLVLPHEERLCILAAPNTTISELRARVFHAIQFYSIYKEYLSFCSIHLELKIDDASYAVPDHYLLGDVVKPNDVFIVTFIENEQYKNRQSIQMNAATASDIHNRKKFESTQPQKQRQKIQNIQSSHNQQIEQKNNLRSDDDGKRTPNEIRQWTKDFVLNKGSLHAQYQCEYKHFVNSLQNTFPNSLQSILRQQNNGQNLQYFLIETCKLSIVQNKDQWIIQREASTNDQNYQQQKPIKKSPKSPPKIVQKRAQKSPNSPPKIPKKAPPKSPAHSPPTRAVKPPIAHSKQHILPPLKVNGAMPQKNNEKIEENGAKQYKKNKTIKIAKCDLPTTPDSPSSDDHFEVSQQKEDEEEEEEKVISFKSETQKVPTEQFIKEEIVEISNNNSVMELLPEIIQKCYLKLRDRNEDCHKYVILNELEREVKSTFRDTTPYQLNIAELNFVCFRQLLLMQFADTLKLEIVFIEKRLIDKTLQFEKSEKIKKNGREYEACPDIECYVILSGADLAKNDDEKDKNVIDENIKFLKRCNVVCDMTADDVYFHLKLIHSECSMRTLEQEAITNEEFGNNHYEKFNSFDEIASELRQNNIDGSRILNMQWSDWEMLHDLDRFDGDHQDFVEDIVFDFFFPFLIAQQLSNKLAKCSKYNAHSSIFEDEAMRTNMTLCVDYALFYCGHPILHFFIKKAEVEDCNKLLSFHHHLSVDEVVGDYSAMHIAAWRGKFKLLAYLTNYGGDPMKKNKDGETALEAGKKYQPKLKWYIAQFPEFQLN